jgi:NTE family protein
MNLFRRPVIGLALGGGGARGLAHIGVLKVFEREQIPIDCLAGTSMGGILAAACARGMPAADLEAEAMRMAQMPQLIKLVDFAPLRRGLVEGNRVRDYLGDFFGHTTLFAHLRLPLAVVAVDLSGGEEIVISEGNLLNALLATAAAPGVFSPVSVDGRDLVDGGVLNNVPADVVRRLGAEVVIAVDVGQQPGADNPWRQSPILRLAADVWEAQVVMGAALVSYRLKEAHPEVLLYPAVPPDVSMLLGFTRAAEIIAAGEAAAEAALPEIRKRLQPRLRLW